jgi:hypothetical protein
VLVATMTQSRDSRNARSAWYGAGNLKACDWLTGGRGELSQNRVLRNDFENDSTHEIPRLFPIRLIPLGDRSLSS